jgi:hypothetical protein
MRISELVSKLELLKAKYGDLNVEYIDRHYDDSYEIIRVVPRHPYIPGQWEKVEDKTQPPTQIDLV